MHFDKSGDVVSGETGFKSAVERIEDIGIFTQDSGGRSDFIKDNFDNLFLVFTAMAITVGISVAFTRKSERTVSVDVVVARVERTIAIFPTGEGIIDVAIDGDAADSVDEVFDEVEVDASVVVDIDVEQVFDGGHRELDTANAASVG